MFVCNNKYLFWDILVLKFICGEGNTMQWMDLVMPDRDGFGEEKE